MEHFGLVKKIPLVFQCYHVALNFPSTFFPLPPFFLFYRQGHVPDRIISWWLHGGRDTLGNAVFEVDESREIEEGHLHEGGAFDGGIKVIIG